jgi:lipopolysaccharide transport system permease protein
MPSQTRPDSALIAALRDWWAGTRNAELWGTLAWYDVVLRYRRSLLGPLWLTISTGAMLLGMGPLYSMLLDIPINRFFPHLTLGIIFWGFFTSAINDGCGVFYTNAQYLKQPGFPPLALVWRCLARNLIQLAHTIILFIPVALWFDVPVTSRALLFVPGLVVVLINLQAAMITLGVLTARYRDVAQIVTSVLALLLFLTPVFWFPDVLSHRARFILWNPFAQLLAIVRLPLLGGLPASGTIIYMVLFTVFSVLVAAVTWAIARRRLVYWV